MNVQDPRELALIVDLATAAIKDHRGGCAPESCGGTSYDPCEVANRIAILKNYQGADSCTCDPNLKMYCASQSCQGGADAEVWVERTWRDVREGDAVRVPGNPASAATATRVGPVNHWHAAPDASQYRPNDSPMEWAGINVTLTLPDGTTNTPPYGMNPDAPVEIHTTHREVDAIELLGGWGQRIVTAIVPHTPGGDS